MSSTAFKSELRTVAQQYKLKLRELDSQVLSDLARQYISVYTVANNELTVLTGKIADAKALGEAVTPGWLYREGRLQILIQQVSTELSDFATAAQEKIATGQSAALDQAVASSKQMVSAALSLPPGNSFAALWTQIAPQVIAQIAANTAPGGPVFKLLDSISPEGAVAARDAIVNGVAQGYNPLKVATQLRDSLDIPLTRAQTIARTEMMRSQREVTRASYAENSDVVTGYLWSSAMDDNTCEDCWALEGEWFETDIEPEAHINCRCTLVPDVAPLADLGMADAGVSVDLPPEIDPNGIADQVTRAGGKIDSEGNATVYHFTSPEVRDIIERSGWMKSEYMDNIYFTTDPTSLVQTVTDEPVVMMPMVIPLKDLNFEFVIKGRNEVHFTVPATKGVGIDVSKWLTSGPAKFAQLSPERQLKILGPAKYRAYQVSAVQLRDFIGHSESPIWGPSTYARSLKEILGEDARQFYVTPKSPFARVAASRFNSEYAKALAAPGGECLAKYTLSEFAKMRTYLGYGGQVGGALKSAADGTMEAVSLFNHGGPRGAGIKMLDELRRRGATRLDCYAPLRSVYEKAGWKVTETVKWDDKFAPTDWNYEKYGRPDVYIMEPSQ